LVDEQLADIAAMQKKQESLTGHADAADGTVEVTVNSRGHVIKIAVDESYLDDHEFEELAEHLTRAARTATDEVGRRVAEMMVPIDERRRAFPSLSDIVEGAPDFRDLMPSGLEVESSPRPPVPGGEDGGEDSGFPTVRS